MEDTVFSVVDFDQWKNEIVIMLSNMKNEWGFDVAVNKLGFIMRSAVDGAV